MQGSYTLSIAGGTESTLRFISSGNNGLEYTSAYLNGTFTKTYTVTDNAAYEYMYLDVQNGATVNSTIYVQLEKGITATDYEPYKGNTYSVNWETEAGTVYGGSLDVVSGKLIVDFVLLSFDGTEAWNLISTKAYLVLWNSPPSISNNDLNQISNYLIGGGVDYMKFGKYRAQTNGAIVIGNIANTQEPYTYKWETAQEFKEYLAGHPLQVCYELATPTEIQLTPQQIKTLLGMNNIWCDSGDVTVDYWKWGK